MSERIVISMGEDATRAEVGGKAAALMSLTRSGLPVPPWVVLTPAAFYASLTEAQRRTIENSDDHAAIKAIAQELHPGDAVRRAIDQQLEAQGLTERLLAVRSSAVEEDASGHSFAGQLESYLAVPREQLAARVAAVWRSGFSERVLTYRKERGLAVAPTPPAVLVQAFVDAQSAGVAFSADPVSGRRSVAVVSAVPGLGTALVGGDADADTWRIDRNDQIIDRQIARKTTKHVPDPDTSTGTRAESLTPVEAEEPTLNDDQVTAVAQLARRTSRHFTAAQDIEWAIRDGELLLLQSRPITSLQHMPDPDARLQLWDNSNIAESYSGITTPLTFSFARRAYEGVYRQFCLMLRVSRRKVQQHASTFANMLGLIRGRVYYNLLNWYRMLSLLPGFAANRRFMEQMMGVREGLPDEMLAEFASASRGERWRDMARLPLVISALIWEHVRLPRSIRAFYRRLNDALRDPDPPLAAMRLDELADEYSRLERALITRWDAPLINDFFAMIFFGVLRSLTHKWGKSADGETDTGQLHNHLLCAEGGIISAEPAQRIRAMAEGAREAPALVRTLCEADADDAVVALKDHPQLHQQFTAYRDRFGDRCLEELKLESKTLMDDPTPLLRSIGYAARRRSTGEDPGEADRKLRAEAEQRIGRALKGRPLRRLIYRWVLRHARRRVRDRENLRFERTRLFGRVRRIFVEMGERLAVEGALTTPRDVFYLTVDELTGFVDGTTTCTDLAGLVRVRREEFERYAQQPPPADRFQTRGAVPIGNAFTDTNVTHHDEARNSDVTELRGVGACPGIVRGTVRLIRDPRGVELPEGTIVVAERTDPGWIMLFPAAAGMLVEHGSLLSHSAIVSRELGVPSIVSIPGITQKLRDGQRVEMDGQDGTVRLLDDDAPPPNGAETGHADRSE